MNGTATKLVDVTVPFTLDGKEMFIENSDDDVGLDEITKFLTMPLPSFSENNALLPADSNDEFLRLTTTVRAVYFSYLHKCLVSNYILCYKQKDEDMPCNNLKQCADQLELSAVRRSLEASLYRQNMLKLISDIKSHTSKKKVFRNLVIFLETSSNKVDVGVQTSSPWVVDSATSVEDADSLENISDLAGCNETSDNITNVTIKEDAFDPNTLDCLVQDSGIDRVTSRRTNALPSCQRDSINSSSEFHAKDLSQMLLNENAMDEYQAKCVNEVHTDDGNALKLQNSSVQLHQEDENSQDSLLQHMEDMFCESDDSSDLTTLIEKHSGVTKANIYNEIRQMCVDTEPLVTSTSCYVPEKINVPKTRVTKPQNSSPGKFSFSYYKEMKNRKTDKAATVAVTVDTLESKQKQRSNGIWFVERVHQMSKLKAKMTELSLTNYRKHGRVKEKFVELFGESDIEDMLPDSPICIEEHLTSCKERIAPWIVKCLMPFYKKRRIKDRQLFKAVAKHIADMLIIENTFPEENCVSKYIENYFKNKKFIKTKQDIYL